MTTAAWQADPAVEYREDDIQTESSPLQPHTLICLFRANLT